MKAVVFAFVSLTLAVSAEARTWRVEKDGTGDFSILYEAADACAAGDTILIGPGRYEEYRREPDYIWNAYCCIHLGVSDVALIGSGLNVTVIGFENFDQHAGHFVIGISCNGDNNLSVRNLTVSAVEEGIHFQGMNLGVEQSDFVGCDIGVATASQESATFHQCSFVASQDDGVFGAHSNGVSITECEFVDGEGAAYSISGVGGRDWIVRDTIIRDCTGGIHFERGATGVIERCSVHVAGGNAPPVGLQTGSVFTLYDNVFAGEHWAASFLTNGTVVTAYNNVFQGGDYTCIEIGSTPMDFHSNQILNGGGASVLALWQRGSLTEPAHVDLSGNYWGTTDPIQIAAWIDDYNDHPPQDNYHYVIVDYEPVFDPTPVPELALAQRLSLSAAPNPFNPRTTVRYVLTEDTPVDLRVYDLAGRLVRSLDVGVRSAGAHAATWNGEDEQGKRASSGVYLVRLTAGTSTKTVRLVLVK